MKSFGPTLALLLLLGCILTACQTSPPGDIHGSDHEILHIYPDGSMRFRGKPIPEKDVVIYEDGYGGEKAAVRIRMEPLHPDFFRDTIVVERVEVIRENQEE